MYSKETSKDAMQDASSRRYHHGDLRSAVIDTALNMLREEKGWQFTLREVARRAGVSHAAPYKHFPDKAALLVELAMIGFDRLRESLSAAKSDAPITLRDEFTSLARAYVTFGTDNPALYRLMFSAEEGKTVGMHLSERALAVFNVALEILLRGQAAGGIRKRPVEGQAAACWGLVHGLTLLAIDGLLIPEKVGPSPLDAALNTLVEGLENPSHMTQ
jgi:AcrR family transcriptional regulator